MERCRRCGLWSPQKKACTFCGSDGYAVPPLLSQQASFSRKLAAGVMTAGSLRALCRDEGGPTTPAAVTQLHCQCAGFKRISEDLAAYSELEILHLEKNHFERIENLDRLHRLTCLHLQGVTTCVSARSHRSRHRS